MVHTFDSSNIQISNPWPKGFRPLPGGVIVSHVNAEAEFFISTKQGKARVTFEAKNGYGAPLPAGYFEFELAIDVNGVPDTTLKIPASMNYVSATAVVNVPTNPRTRISFRWINDYSGAKTGETNLDIRRVIFDQSAAELVTVSSPAPPGFGLPRETVPAPVTPVAPAVETPPESSSPPPSTAKKWILPAAVIAVGLWIWMGK